jgi:hypothetical protein
MIWFYVVAMLLVYTFNSENGHDNQALNTKNYPLRKPTSHYQHQRDIFRTQLPRKSGYVCICERI